ncbi:MAG: hypothetical protein EOO44_01080 [Flavobacterium sp.]|nr:MAG: hypothetical protein EOO44_01080 [Flavobacterium sp.]
MTISIYIEPISKVDELIKFLLQNEFKISEETADLLFDKQIKKHFERLTDNLYLVAETNYVDKVYRDSYYHYYSSKLSVYQRNCIRISLFSKKVDLEDFRREDQLTEIQDAYLGYMIMRPNEPYIVGRSVISPLALTETNFNCCTTVFDTTVNSVKLKIEGFPYSTQDSETITCAETTLWALMEYYSHRYAEYRPILPSRIIQTLNKVSSERQIPSKGLNVQQMSFALKEFGFGARIYSQEQYSSDFNPLLSCYIASGIPLIIAMENRPEGTIGHSLLCVGHERVVPEMVKSLSTYPLNREDLRTTVEKNGISVYDYDSINKQFLFVDDNRPVYQKAYLDTPAAHYSGPWQECKITYFIVPLYPKIHLEAFEAKNFIWHFLIEGPEPLSNGTEVLLRTYLASSRSFKDKLAVNNSFSSKIKDLILEMAMPKFIWVGELSNRGLIEGQKANGLIILDATEANIYFNKPLIIAAYQDKVINFEADSGKLTEKNLTLSDFSIFENNLKPFFT